VVSAVGARRALQIFLAEDSFSAAQAYDWGLLARVVPASELKAATRALAERLAKNPLSAIAATKALIHSAATNPIDAQLDAEKDAIIDCMHTDDFRAAVKKFLDKGK
jgi:enoyl-CoA hydratase/carnithine racemase